MADRQPMRRSLRGRNVVNYNEDNTDADSDAEESSNPPPQDPQVAVANNAGADDDDHSPTEAEWESAMPSLPVPRDQREDNITLFFEMLECYDLMYIYQLTIGQLATLAKKLIKSQEAQQLRKPAVQRLVDEFHRTHGDDERLHDQELNELCCIIDYIVKIKCNIHSILSRLEEGDPRFIVMHFPNDDFDGTPLVPDVCVFLPERLRYEICQGAANRWFDDYQNFDGHVRYFDPARYLLCLFSARVYDTEAKRSFQDGVSLGTHEEGEEPRHFGVGGIEHDVFRPLSLTPARDGTGAYLVDFNDPNGGSGGDFQKFRLHRIILVVANQLGVTVFNDGNLEDIGLTLPEGSNYDRHFVYRPLTASIHNNERSQILNALRVGDRHSRDCDGDHCLGSSTVIYCHGLTKVKPAAHRINTCNIYVRKNAGHWCCALILSQYTDGQTTNLVDDSFVERITWEGDEPRFEGNPIAETDVFDLLPRLDNWITDIAINGVDD